MEAHLHVGTPRSMIRSEVDPTVRRVDLSTSGLLAAGGLAGVLGGLVMALPVVLWDWTHDGHRALELPMAATAWLFGLQHFSHDRNLWSPIVIGSVVLVAYWLLNGVAYAALADRVFKLAATAPLLVAGLIWGVVSYMVFWYFLLPIARDGEPFRLDLAPPWVWIVAFTLLGVATGACYAALRSSQTIGRGLAPTTSRCGHPPPARPEAPGRVVLSAGVDRHPPAVRRRSRHRLTVAFDRSYDHVCPSR